MESDRHIAIAWSFGTWDINTKNTKIKNEGGTETKTNRTENTIHKMKSRVGTSIRYVFVKSISKQFYAQIRNEKKVFRERERTSEDTFK